MGNLDYICCWFLKASHFIEDSNSKYAFVTTNSISQGEQVSLLWPLIFCLDLEIFFAHPSFKWTNNAKDNAGVIVSIIGVSKIESNIKTIFIEGMEQKVKSINAYLTTGSKVFIQKRMKPLSKLPEMNFGSMANDGGHLLLSAEEREKIISIEPKASKFIKKLVGSLEFIRGIDKYCIWVKDNDVEEAQKIELIQDRINKTRISREGSKRIATNKLASIPHAFAERRYEVTDSIIVPSVSSERREYIPMGFLGPENVIVAPNFAIYRAKPWHLALLTSKMHMIWVKTVSGKLKSDYRYSTSLCYNTFPFPKIGIQKEEELTQTIFKIIEEREKHSDRTLAELYDPDKMPLGLKEAHRLNNEVIERCYRVTPFRNDEERLEYLFNLYEKMIEEEKNSNTLFEKQKKSTKKNSK